jgi:hypothetical protein
MLSFKLTESKLENDMALGTLPDHLLAYSRRHAHLRMLRISLNKLKDFCYLLSALSLALVKI